MDKNQKRMNIAILFSALIILGIILEFREYNWNNYGDSENHTEPNLKGARSWDLTGTPIYINNDDPSNNWLITATTYEWCRGSGLSNDPYIIENVTIDAQKSGSCIKIINSDVSFIIRNCTLFNSQWYYDAGIKLYDTSNGKLIENNCSNNNGNGINLIRSNDNIVEENLLCNNNLHGIDLSSVDNNYISKNIINNNLDCGVYINDGLGNTISTNTITNNTNYGIFFNDNCRDNNIDSNSLINSSYGILFAGYNDDSNDILRNYISNNDYGISIAGNNDDSNDILRNYISNNDYGIYIESRFNDHNTISENDIKNNNIYGIILLESSQNTIYKNNFSMNVINGYDDGTNNHWNWNYWDDYTGEDLDEDGIGDTPYTIPGTAGSQDSSPIYDGWPDEVPDGNGDLDLPPIDSGLFGLGFLIIVGILASVMPVFWLVKYSKSQNLKKRRILKEKELEASKFENLLMKSRELDKKAHQFYSKGSFSNAIDIWNEIIGKYYLAIKKAPSAKEKKKIRDNLKILKESMFNAYKGKANVYNKNALKAYEKSDLQIAQKEWRLAISSFQAAIDLNKVEKLKFSPDDLQKAIKNTEIRLKQLEIEMVILDADNELKDARSLQKKDLRKAIKMVNGIILTYSETKEKANKNTLFRPLSEKLEARIIKCRDFQLRLQDKMDELIGITPISKKIKVDEMDIIDYKIPSVIKKEKKETLVSIVREFEFIGGQIRFKVGLKNNTKFAFTSLKVTFNIPDALKWILHEPGYERKGDSILISKLGVNEKKVISLYLEPINCMESPINATVSFFDVRDRPHASTMRPKMISITCPIFFTEVDANLARVKSLRRKLAHHDRKIFPLIKSEESLSIFSSILSVLEKFDIKSIFKDFSEEDRFGEAWFYGITKVKKNQIVIYVLLDGASKEVEIEVSGNDDRQITAFLAEIGDRTRKQLIHNKIIDIEGEFYDLRVSILSNLCPYCYSSISGDQVQNIINGKIIRCKNCDVDLKINER